MQDPLAEYKKNSDWFRFSDIRKHIESVDEVEGKEASKLFGITFGDLGIYKISNKGGADLSSLVKCPKWVVEKVALQGKHLSDFATKEPKTKHFIRMTTVYNTSGGTVTNKLITPEFDKAYNNKDANCATVFIAVNSKNEAYNLWSSLHTNFMRYCKVNLSANQTTPMKWLPYLDYTHPWTDEMLYEYFGLTEDEIKEIEQEMSECN